MFLFFLLIWILWEIKYILFWIYLWQLKEYHVGRFVDHFRTHKGQRIFLNIPEVLKLLLLILFLAEDSFFIYLFPALFLIYLAEVILFIRVVVESKLKKPVITPKTAILLFVSFVILAGFIYIASFFLDAFQPVLLLGFDILTPVIISIIVLLIQPVFVIGRNSIVKKALVKMKNMQSVSGIKVIVITGSYGKTSTKEFLTAILSKKFKVLATKNHQNSEIAIAKCILNNLKPEHQIFIAEVGAYNKGKVKEVCSMVQPKIGIVTGVNEQHLALFGSLENLLLAEGGGELAESVPENGLLVLNGSNKYCMDLAKKTEKPKKIYSQKKELAELDIWADSVTVNKESVSFLVQEKEGNLLNFEMKVLGRHNVENILAVILTARHLGMSLEEVSQACKNIKPEQAGMVLKLGKHGINIIDSSYSANSDGVLSDLDYLSIFPAKKVVIMPCLIELGPKSAEIHRKIGEKIAKVCSMAIIITKDKFRNVKDGAVKAGMSEENILLCDNPQDIYSIITTSCKQGDTVLLEGRVPQQLINFLK